MTLAAMLTVTEIMAAVKKTESAPCATAVRRIDLWVIATSET